jgi:hypothetical protein
MQRVEGTIGDMSQTMENIYTLLKNIDDKVDRLTVQNNTTHQRSARSTMSVKFPSLKEGIP